MVRQHLRAVTTGALLAALAVLIAACGQDVVVSPPDPATDAVVDVPLGEVDGTADTAGTDAMLPADVTADAAPDTDAPDPQDVPDDAATDADTTLPVDSDTGADAGSDVAPEDAIVPCEPADCADGNPCTADECLTSGCAHLPQEATCDDGDACTMGDACSEGTCKGGGGLCDDDNGCTADSCAQGVCTHTPIDGACTDGNGCTENDTCKAGVCEGTPSCTCAKDADCDDQNPCTTETCQNLVCIVTKLPVGAACDDGNACTAGETCLAQGCTPAAAVACEEETPCMLYACDPLQGCKGFAKQGVCDDGSACTKGDVCDAGQCVSGPGCDDGNPCTADTCDPQTGCSSLNAGGPCMDGNLCTTGEQCVDGACKAPAGLLCDDSNPCTIDSCDLGKGCVHQAVGEGSVCEQPSCDGLTHRAGSTCDAGVCVPVKAPTACDDQNACTDDKCTPLLGCSHKDNVAVCQDGDACTTGDACAAGACKSSTAVVCDDKNPCTDDACDPAKGCTAVPNVVPCDDGSVCTQSDVCAAGTCQPGTKVACDDKNACTDDVCDPVLGCQNKANVNPCDDGNACSTGDTCTSGVCKATGGAICNDGNPCTVDGCDAQKNCVYTPLPDATACSQSACTDGVFQGAAVCTNGTCGAVPAAKNCLDGNPCTTDLCNAAQGCLNTANSDACNDGSACTDGDACANGTCSGVAIPCKDGNACTDDACDAKTGCTFTANAAPCSDGNACTDADACKGGSCVAGAALDCDDKNPCTTDSCDSAKGCLFTENGLACDDANACTTQDACKTGKCVGGAPLNCNDLNTCTADACDPSKGCVNTAVTDGASCADGVCTSLVLQPAATCQAGKCVTPAVQDCNDQSVCTVDTCANTGCVNQAANDGFPCGPNAFCAKGTCQTCALYSKAVSTLGGSELRGVAAWGKGVVVAGTVPTNQNGDNGLLMAIKEDGTVAWTASRGGNNDDGFRAIAPAANGDYFVAGYSDIGGSQQGWIARIAGATGAQIWTQSLGGGSNNDWFSGLVATADGGVVVVGWTPVNNAGENGWAVKYTGTGTVVWNRTNLGGQQDDRLYGIVELPTGGFVAVGSTSTQSSGGRDGWSLRLGLDGTVWGETRYGGSQNDDLFGLVLLSDGSTVAAGYSASPGGLGNGDGWVVRMALNGSATWQQRFGTNWGTDALYGISVAGNGDLVAAGYRAAIGGTQDWLVRLQAATGQAVATPFTQALSAASGNTGLYAVLVLADETIAAVGRYNNQGWAIRSSSAGSVLCGP